jgi:hypothetical protein
VCVCKVIFYDCTSNVDWWSIKFLITCRSFFLLFFHYSMLLNRSFARSFKRRKKNVYKAFINGPNEKETFQTFLFLLFWFYFSPTSNIKIKFHSKRVSCKKFLFFLQPQEGKMNVEPSSQEFYTCKKFNLIFFCYCTHTFLPRMHRM